MTHRRIVSTSPRRLAVVSLVVLTGVFATAGFSSASAPDVDPTGALAVASHPTVLGMSVATALWAFFGVLALTAGLFASTRSRERESTEADATTVVVSGEGSTGLAEAVLAR